MMYLKKLILLTLALATVLSLTACGAKEPNGAAATDSPFAAMDTVDLNGNSITSDAFAGNKLTLVNLWNLGCTACIDEMPALQQLSQEYADKGVGVMGLYYNFGQDISADDRAKIAEVLTNAGATFPHLVPSADMMETKQLKKMSVFPTTFFVDAQGNIVGSEMGSRDFEDWAKVVDKLLEKIDG